MLLINPILNVEKNDTEYLQIAIKLKIEHVSLGWSSPVLRGNKPNVLLPTLTPHSRNYPELSKVHFKDHMFGSRTTELCVRF